MIAVYAGGEAEAREVLAPFLELEPEAEMIAEMPYAEIQCAIDDPPGYRNYWSAEHLASFPDEALEAFCRRAHDMVVPSPSQHILFPWGGAVARSADDWPLPHRSAPWVAHPLGLWEDPRTTSRRSPGRGGSCADMRPYATGASTSTSSRRGEDRVDRRLRARELRPARRGQGRVRPRQRLPPAPQHQAAAARLSSRAAAGADR